MIFAKPGNVFRQTENELPNGRQLGVAHLPQGLQGFGIGGAGNGCQAEKLQQIRHF